MSLMKKILMTLYALVSILGILIVAMYPVSVFMYLGEYIMLALCCGIVSVLFGINVFLLYKIWTKQDTKKIKSPFLIFNTVLIFIEVFLIV